MCTELLTPGGWQPMTVHALLLTVCQMLREGEAQIQLKPDEHCMWPLKDYSEMEAREAYERVAKFHGWPTQRRHSEYRGLEAVVCTHSASLQSNKELLNIAQYRSCLNAN